MSGADRLLDVLVTVATAAEPLPAKRIGELAAIPLSSAYRHLTLLRERGFIVDLGRDAGYAPGPICLRIAQNLDRTSHLVAIALPEMRNLCLETKESVGLMKAVGGEVYCLEMIESPLSLRCSFSKGRSQPLIRGASAKALLAFLPQTVRDEICARLLGEDASMREALRDELNRIREQGYAESEGEVDLGIWGASAPVFSGGTRLEASLSLMAPTVRVGERRSELIKRTIEAAKAVSLKLHQA